MELERWHQQQAAQRGYSQPAAQQGYAQPPFEPSQPAQGYAQLHNDPLGHASRPSAAASEFANAAGLPRGQNPFAPQFERFAPPQHPAPAGYDHHPGPPQPDLRGPYDASQQHGYDQRAFAPHHEPVYPPPDGRDPQSWDLSQYQPGQVPQGYASAQAYEEPAHAPRSQPVGWPPQGTVDPHWHQPAHQPGQWVHPEDPQLPVGYAPQPGNPYSQHLDPSFDQRGLPHDHGYDADDVDAVDEPRRGPSTLLIVSMLVGAIVVGGGLAFAYKQFAGGGSIDKAKVAELKRPSAPEKVRPQDPGGKTMEHSDKKFLNRLGSDAPVDNQRQSDVEGSAKKVATIPIVVNRDGSLTPQAQPPSSGESGVPGLVLDGFGPPPVGNGGAPQLRTETGPGPGQPSRLPPPAPPVVRAAPPAAPKVADLPLPRVNAAPAVDRQAAAPPKKQKAAVRDDLISQQVGGASSSDEAPSGLGSAVAPPPRKPVAASSGSGYVAVLASKKSRQDALNSFADLHSQYPDVLGGMTPDVREANLGDKGLWYRLIVGPPGSRDAARNVCVKLKDKGFKDCWPVAY